MIESVNNTKVKLWTKLTNKKYQNVEGLFLIEGEHLVEEAYKCGYLEEVIILSGFDFNYPNKSYVNDNVMRKISSLTSIPKIIGVAKKIKPKEIKGRVLLLDVIQDPGNMGTIIRSAVAFNIDSIVVGSGSVSIYNPKVIRATEGLFFHINIIECNLEKIILDLKNKDYVIYSTNLENGKNIRDILFPLKCAIIIGNEGSGVSNNIEKYSDEKIYIDMNKKCESLNAGVATSIILYELDK